jgi:cysteine-rich repeat protein
MRTRIWLPVLLCGSTVALSGCPDDAPVDPDDGTSTGSSTGAGPTSDSSSTGVDPDSTGEAPGCGDGLVAQDEQCDDDDIVDGDGCSATCTLEPGWQCQGQPTSCFAVCGDGIQVGEEQCDDDNIDEDDGCSVDCLLEDGWACEGIPSTCVTVCGDGFVVGEICDDGNTDAGDGCSATCEQEEGFLCEGAPSACAAVCGDGLILGEEQCDDNDLSVEDGCDATCMIELGWSCDGEPSVCLTGCGDGIAAGTEQCDDLNLVDGDGCTAACLLELGWICTGMPSVCNTECGDGFQAGTEECDDDGLVAGDGCDPACVTEPGWMCAGQPSACDTICGDGTLVGTEACDDGNIALGDGCEFDCAVGFGWSCAGSPSTCTELAVVDALELGGFGGCVLTSLGEVGCFGDNVQSEVGNGTDNVEVYVPVFTLDDAAAIAAGEEFHCAIRAAGDVWCWGDNLQLVMGPTVVAGTDQPLPIAVGGVPVSAAIEAGDDHACVIDLLGAVWCWGDNDFRQLGRGDDTTDSPDATAVALPGGLSALDLGLGQDHSCAVLSDGTVACWGDDDNGQLGDGTSGLGSGAAALVPGLAAIVDVEAGEDTNCAIDDLGQLFCWGDGIDGQLGVGSTLDSANPQPVVLPAVVEDVTLGDQFACVLLVNDEVWCWGEGSDFQVGSGNFMPVLSPIQVPNIPAVDLVDIESGGRGSCVTSVAGERWCWGYSGNGNLGFAPLRQLEPVAPSFSGPLQELVLDAPQEEGVLCGVLLDGSVECTGDGTLVNNTTSGPRGYFDPITHHLVVPTPLPALADVQDMDMGFGFACAATSTDVQCWGDNSNRQLGQGGIVTADIYSPVPVMGLGAVDELETGSLHACVRVGGTVQCWGNNFDFQTGDSSGTTDVSLPFTVPNLADAVDIALGQSHSCALRATGVVSCWGDDLNGQMGDNDMDPADPLAPVDVTGLPPGVTQVTAGQDHACALAGGEVYCWGEAQFGQLGQNDDEETDSDTALLVPGLTGIVQLVAGYNYNCALDGAGDMWCWGEGADGHLGDGGRVVTGLTEVRAPTPFVVASGITDMELGFSITCIETAPGWSCLGRRSSGQLGNGTTVRPVFPSATMFGP